MSNKATTCRAVIDSNDIDISINIDIDSDTHFKI